MSQENVELIRGLYEAFARGDVEDVMGRMSPDIVWNEAENFPYSDGNPYVGPGAIAAGAGDEDVEALGHGEPARARRPQVKPLARGDRPGPSFIRRGGAAAAFDSRKDAKKPRSGPLQVILAVARISLSLPKGILFRKEGRFQLALE